MRNSGRNVLGVLSAILLVAACVAGPATQEPSPAGDPGTPAPVPSPTDEPMATVEPTEAAAPTRTPSRNPDDYYGAGDAYGPGGDSTAAPTTAPTTSAGEETAQPGEATVGVAHSATHELYLVGPAGLALYVFTEDAPGASSCSGGCAEAWPPLTVAMGETPIAGPGVHGTLDTIVRDDGSHQVTYNDMPLYYFASDTEPGDTTGHEVGGVWFLAEP